MDKKSAEITVHTYNRYSLTLMALIFLFPFYAFANTSELINSTKSNISQVHKNINANYYKAVNAINKKLVECSNSNTIINKSDVQSISESWEVISTALIYFNAKNQQSCMKSELDDFAFNSSLLLAFDENNQEKIIAMNYIVMKLPLMFEEAKNDYFSLPEHLQIKFSNVDKLQKPFNLLESAEKLNPL